MQRRVEQCRVDPEPVHRFGERHVRVHAGVVPPHRLHTLERWAVPEARAGEGLVEPVHVDRHRVLRRPHGQVERGRF